MQPPSTGAWSGHVVSVGRSFDCKWSAIQFQLVRHTVSIGPAYSFNWSGIDFQSGGIGLSNSHSFGMVPCALGWSKFRVRKPRRTLGPCCSVAIGNPTESRGRSGPRTMPSRAARWTATRSGSPPDTPILSGLVAAATRRRLTRCGTPGPVAELPTFTHHLSAFAHSAREGRPAGCGAVIPARSRLTGRPSCRVGAGGRNLAAFDHVGGVGQLGQQGRVGFGDDEREVRCVLA